WGRASGPAGAQPLEARQRARRGPERLEPVEGRNARPRLVHVDARPGEGDLVACAADGDPERAPLGGDARRLGREPGDVELLPVRVEQDRVLDDLSREELLREARDEDDVEREP